jgi:hypothetical protein
MSLTGIESEYISPEGVRMVNTGRIVDGVYKYVTMTNKNICKCLQLANESRNTKLVRT